jgi:hypothetical protein
MREIIKSRFLYNTYFCCYKIGIPILNPGIESRGKMAGIPGSRDPEIPGLTPLDGTIDGGPAQHVNLPINVKSEKSIKNLRINFHSRRIRMEKRGEEPSTD